MKELRIKRIPEKFSWGDFFHFLENNPQFEDLNCSRYIVFPGFADVHVHFREPGFSYKGTIKDGTLAAAHGGYTTVCTMPNLKPVPDNYEHLKEEMDIINKDAVISVVPYGSITVNEEGEEIAALDEMKDYVVAFSDDGRGIQDGEVMRKAMLQAKALGKIVVAHCEVNSLLHGGYIHDGIYAKEHGHRGICSASEYEEIARDCQLALETGCKYHVCHISTKESVEIIRKYKAMGADVTCETAPHYLVLDENDLKEEGRWKMNPPLRSREDKEALIKGLQDGTIDMIATDHAPHSPEEKSRGLEKSPFGIVGIETSFQVCYTYLVKKGIISLEKLIELLAINPRKRFNLPYNGYTVWDLEEKTIIDSSKFLSKGKATPFEGYEVYGKNIATFYKEKKVW